MAVADLAYLDDTGFHFADYPAFLAYFQAEFRRIYGADVVLDADTQDGQWVAILAQAAYDTAALAAAVYSSFSPATGRGSALSRNVAINGIARQVATKSQVDLTLVGTPGATVLNGVAEDALNQRWVLPPSVTIGSGGSVIVTALAENAGDLAAAAGTITTIATPARGWQTVTNVSAAVVGAPVETDAALRRRQAESVSIPSLSVMGGITGAVADVDGVTHYRGYENDSGATDGDGIPAHSVCLVVSGGDVQEIAEAIARKKTPGTGTFGNTSATVSDSAGMSNTINFERPTLVEARVRITVEAFSGYSSAYGEQIVAAVAAYINSRAIGDDLLITRLYVPAALGNSEAGSTYEITALELAEGAGAFGTANIVVGFNERAVVDVADIEVVVT
jgi:uncharacterized phage protein gp47/JayE